MKQNDAETYRECSVPKTVEQANVDWEAFVQAVYELRCKHRIADLYMVAQHPVLFEDDEGSVNAVAYCGDAGKRESLAAWAFGYESANRQAAIASIVARAAKDSIKQQRAQKELF